MRAGQDRACQSRSCSFCSLSIDARGSQPLRTTEESGTRTLPRAIADLQAEAAKLQTQLGDPQFYTRDRASFEKATAALGAIQLKIAAAEEQWLELEILREELSAS